MYKYHNISVHRIGCCLRISQSGQLQMEHLSPLLNQGLMFLDKYLNLKVSVRIL